jgi:hypothetical protein
MSAGRIATATRMDLREQTRRPLLIVLLVGLPFFFITRAIAITEPLPRAIALPGGGRVLTTMRDLHGASMATITIAFLAGLCGIFIMQSARHTDRRLVLAGFSAMQSILPRMLVLAAGTVLVVVVSVLVTGLSFTPRLWGWFVVGNLLVGLTYASLGALAGALIGGLAATYLILFGAMLDLGVLQDPMFGNGTPHGLATVLPGYGPARVVVDASFAFRFHAWPQLLIALGWAAVLAIVVTTVLGRSVKLAADSR